MKTLKIILIINLVSLLVYILYLQYEKEYSVYDNNKKETLEIFNDVVEMPKKESVELIGEYDENTPWIEQCILVDSLNILISDKYLIKARKENYTIHKGGKSHNYSYRVYDTKTYKQIGGTTYKSTHDSFGGMISYLERSTKELEKNLKEDKEKSAFDW